MNFGVRGVNGIFQFRHRKGYFNEKQVDKHKGTCMFNVIGRLLDNDRQINKRRTRVGKTFFDPKTIIVNKVYMSVFFRKFSYHHNDSV